METAPCLLSAAGSCREEDLKGERRKDGEGLLVRECTDGARGNGFKVKEGRIETSLI